MHTSLDSFIADVRLTSTVRSHAFGFLQEDIRLKNKGSRGQNSLPSGMQGNRGVFSNSQVEKACQRNLNELGACCAAKARDAPQGEVLLNAHGIHDPVALLASGQCQGRGEVGINGKHAQVRLGRIDGSQGGRRHQCDGHREVGHEVASMLVQFPS